jgi:hypothetical protein
MALKAQQLAVTIRLAEQQGTAAWRRQSVAGAAPSRLLDRRGLPGLHIRVPWTLCGMKPGDSCTFVRECEPATAPRQHADMAQRKGRAACDAAPWQRHATPPQLAEQPVKRSRRMRLGLHSGHLIGRAVQPQLGTMQRAHSAGACSSRPASASESAAVAERRLASLLSRMSHLTTASQGASITAC